MTPRQEIFLITTIAKLEERSENQEKLLNSVSNKLVLLSANTEGDIHSLKYSLKKKINDSVKCLTVNQIDPIKETLKYLTMWAFLQKNYVYLILFLSIILFTFGEKMSSVIIKRAKKEGIEFIAPNKDEIYKNNDLVVKLIN